MTASSGHIARSNTFPSTRLPSQRLAAVHGHRMCYAGTSLLGQIGEATMCVRSRKDSASGHPCPPGHGVQMSGET